MEQNVITYLACICFIFLLGKIFIIPIKTILKLLINSVLGGALIYVINIVGAVYSFHIGLNLITTICIGLLGIPGAILIIILKFLVRIANILAFFCNLVYYNKY